MDFSQVEGFVGAENKGKALGSMLTVGNILLVTALPFTGLLSDKISTPIVSNDKTNLLEL